MHEWDMRRVRVGEKGCSFFFFSNPSQGTITMTKTMNACIVFVIVTQTTRRRLEHHGSPGAPAGKAASQTREEGVTLSLSSSVNARTELN